MKKFFTVTKADLFNVKFNHVMSSMEAANGSVVIVVEDESVKIINKENSIEWDSLELAQAYVRGIRDTHMKINITKAI